MALDFQTIPFTSMDEAVLIIIPFFFLCDGVWWGPRHEGESWSCKMNIYKVEHLLPQVNILSFPSQTRGGLVQHENREQNTYSQSSNKEKKPTNSSLINFKHIYTGSFSFCIHSEITE